MPQHTETISTILREVQRLVRLYQLWNWLPHFRAIAETEHLPAASEALGISPSALSRALKQLEGDVGQQLFIREGRDIRINEAGEELLRAVRLAMRGIDDALSTLADEKVLRTIRIAAPGPIVAALLLDVIEGHKVEFPHLLVELTSCGVNEIVSQLSRGIIDVCIHEQAVAHEELESRRLADIKKVVACSPGHPLAQVTGELNMETIQKYVFAAPVQIASGVHPDGWPTEVPREVTLRVNHMQTGIDACLSGRYLAVLPRTVVSANKLKELAIEGVDLPTVSNFATIRRQDQLPAIRTEFNSFLDRVALAFSAVA